MRPPAFWNRKAGAAALALAPAAAVWTAATRTRLRFGAWRRVGVPVICVGNLTVGGTGKTPATIAVLERLTARGVRAAAVSRGYGGRLPGPVQVDPQRHLAADVGDEPLLLASWAPVWVGRDRAAAAACAVAAGARAVVLDDGFQNPGIAKDLSIVVVDGERGFGNGRVVPAGPLREPVADGVARADLILAVGDAAALLSDWPALTARPVIRGAIVPLPTGMPWHGLRVLAFAGIGHPEKFFATLRGLGADVVRTRAFDDHAPYSRAILERLETEARSLGAQLVTTEKDAVRLPADFRRSVMPLPVRLIIETPDPLDEALDRLLRARAGRPDAPGGGTTRGCRGEGSVA